MWLNLLSLDTYEHTFAIQLTPVLGNNDLTGIAISNVNGSGNDDDSSDDSKKVISIDPMVPATEGSCWGGSNRNVVSVVPQRCRIWICSRKHTVITGLE